MWRMYCSQLVILSFVCAHACVHTQDTSSARFLSLNLLGCKFLIKLHWSKPKSCHFSEPCMKPSSLVASFCVLFDVRQTASCMLNVGCCGFMLPGLKASVFSHYSLLCFSIQIAMFLLSLFLNPVLATWPWGSLSLSYSDINSVCGSFRVRRVLWNVGEVQCDRNSDTWDTNRSNWNS